MGQSKSLSFRKYENQNFSTWKTFRKYLLHQINTSSSFKWGLYYWPILSYFYDWNWFRINQKYVSMECYFGACHNFVGLTFRRTQSEKGRVITTSNQDIMNNSQPHTPIPSLDILLSSETKQLAVFWHKSEVTHAMEK